MDLALQIFGGVLLLAGVYLGYALWVRPREPMDWQARGLLMLTVLAFMGALIGAPFWWQDVRRSFSWDLPPFAARMLGAAAAAFVVSSLLALQSPTKARLRLQLVLLAVYLAPLVALIAAFHTHRFDWGEFITYSFFAIAGGMTVASLWYLARTPEVPGIPADAGQPPRLVRDWLGLLGLVLIPWGLALCITDDGGSILVWAWPGDGLSSSLIGVMLLAIGAGSLYSRSAASAATMMLAVAMTYGAGVSLASLWQTFKDTPIREAYLIVFAAIAFVSLGLLLFVDGEGGKREPRTSERAAVN